MVIISNKRYLDSALSLPPAKRQITDQTIYSLAEEIFKRSLDTSLHFEDPPVTILDYPFNPTNFEIYCKQAEMNCKRLEIISSLNQWCQIEPRNRNAADKILRCWVDQSSVLKLDRLKCDLLPDCFHYFTHLESLTLSGASLTALPNSLVHLSNLKKLYINQCSIVELPNLFYKLINLEELFINNSEFIEFPISICELPKLEKLSITYCEIASLPDRIGNLKRLTFLEMSGTQLTLLPDSFRELCHLETVRLNSTELGVFPEVLCNLPKLKELDLEETELHFLPESIGKLTNLRNLFLESNHIQSLPTQFGELLNLKKLHLSNNGIIEFPEEICKLSNLLLLDLQQNQIVSIPESIGDLSDLQELNLSHNSLEDLPNSLGLLSSLFSLSIADNNIDHIPPSLTRLSRDCEINAEGNLFSEGMIVTIQEEINRVRQEDPTLGPNFVTSIDESDSEDEEIPLPEDLEESLQSNMALLQKPTDREQKLFESFFKKLRYTADYQSISNRAGLVARLNKMFQNGLTNETFRNNLFPILEAATATCSDRVAIYNNLIEVQWHLYCSGKSYNDRELADLLVGLHRMDMLDKIAEVTRVKLGLADPIEAYLYYQLHLKGSLKLPISIQEMRYARTVKQITPDHIQAALQKILASTSSLDQRAKIVCEYDLWKERLKAESDVEMEKVLAEFGARGEALEENELLSEQIKMEKWKELQQSQELRQKNILIMLTKTRLSL